MVDFADSDLYRNIPLGDKVARDFPWWREGVISMSSGVAYRESRFTVGPNATAFKSDRELPIEVDEIRMGKVDTLYVRGGRFFSWLCVAGTVVFLVIGRRRRR